MDSIERPGARFGSLLRGFRQAQTLSQETLAERSGLSVRGVSDLERGLKARPHLETVRLLAEGLGLNQADRAALIAAARPAQVSHRIVPSTLPEFPTAIIGRDAAAAAALALLEQPTTRLLTLTGPGGVGKTRLAAHIGHELAQNGASPVVFVSLASVESVDQFLPAVANALGLPPTPESETLSVIAASLGNRQSVLVLDNLEQLRGVGGPIDELLRVSPNVTIVATSRTPVRSRFEQLFPLPPLARLAGQRLDPNAISRVASVRLFVERAKAVQPDFAITSENAALIGEICDRLEGIPLAIELAARRVRLLTLPALRDLLETRLHVLADSDPERSPRHGSLRAAIASSVDLLDVREQRLLAITAQFPAGSTLDALAAVAGETELAALLNHLERLIDASLLQQTIARTGEPRFTMLESVREFMLESISPDERTFFQRTHAGFVTDLVERAEPELTHTRRTYWIARLEEDYPNLRAAFAWSLEAGERERAYRIGASLWPFWSATGRMAEGTTWLERAISPNDEAPPDVRARALLRFGNLKIDNADYPAALACYRESYAISETIGDLRGQVAALTGEGLVRVIQGDPDAAIHTLDRARSIWQVLGIVRGEAVALMNLGNAHAYAGDFKRANIVLEESLRLRQEADDQAGAGYSLYALGRLARIERDLAAARHYAIRSLRLFHASTDRPGFACALHELGAQARLEGRDQAALAYLRVALRVRAHISDIQAEIDSIEEIALIAESRQLAESATQMLSFCDAWRRRHSAPSHPIIAAAVTQSFETARARLPLDLQSAAESTGRTMTLSDAVVVAQSLVI
jgi:predicted ATPase/DNA-binding XRE family transcriptional regulator